jgi:hypothetical protein
MWFHLLTVVFYILYICLLLFFVTVQRFWRNFRKWCVNFSSSVYPDIWKYSHFWCSSFVTKRAVIAQSVQRLATGLMIGVPGFDSRQGLGICPFITASRTALGPTQPPIQWVPEALSLGLKRSGREADESPSSGAEVRNEWIYTSNPPIRIHGVVLS